MILVVEDSSIQRRKIKSILEKHQFDMKEACNGSEALKKLPDESVKLIMTDLLMPELDGFGLLESLKNSESSTPVIVLSADIQETTKERCIGLGAAAFLNKPLNESEVLDSINRVLSNAAN